MRTIKSMTKDLMADVQRNYKKHGHVSPAIFVVRKRKPAMIPKEVLALFSIDKDKFLKRFRGMLKKEVPEAVMITFQVSYNGNSMDGKANGFVFVFANTVNRQTTYASEIKNRKMGKWREFGVCKNVNGTWLGGNFIVLYGLGTVMDVPKVDR